MLANGFSPRFWRRSQVFESLLRVAADQVFESLLRVAADLAVLYKSTVLNNLMTLRADAGHGKDAAVESAVLPLERERVAVGTAGVIYQ
jgi:hypothetical protein